MRHNAIFAQRRRSRGWILPALIVAAALVFLAVALMMLPKPKGFEPYDENAPKSEMDKAMDEAFKAQRRADEKDRQVRREIRNTERNESSGGGSSSDNFDYDDMYGN
ncbi:hypothetical protein JXA32_17865 [Candidatus Sumerlaeota bacterium]|nr:hypothetical protein [Candidatus Sumerlaeota bacterium]